MKVSVLVPVYGVERYIGQCAESLMEQTYKDVEYIFVNDCTRDDSIGRLNQVLERYPERRSQVRIINHEKNMGVGMARQSGLNAATGDAVIIVDSDDYVAREMIEKLVAKQRSTGAHIVDAGYGIVRNGVVDKEPLPLPIGDKAYLKTILCQNVEPNRIWGRLIMKSLFDENGITFTPGVDYCEDFSVLPRLLVNGKRSWVDECLYFYRDDNSNSYTNNITIKNAVSFLKAQQLVGEYFVASWHWSDYSCAAQIGWVNVWRFSRRFNVEKTVVDEHFSLKPDNIIISSLFAMMRNSRFSYRVANFLYLTARRTYLAFNGR